MLLPYHHCNDNFEVGMAAAPKRAKSCKIQTKFWHMSVCPSVHLPVHQSVRSSVHPSIGSSVHLSIQAPTMAGWIRGGDRQKEGRTDFPCILPDIAPSGSRKSRVDIALNPVVRKLWDPQCGFLQNLDGRSPSSFRIYYKSNPTSAINRKKTETTRAW